MASTKPASDIGRDGGRAEREREIERERERGGEGAREKKDKHGRQMRLERRLLVVAFVLSVEGLESRSEVAYLAQAVSHGSPGP